MMALRLPWRPSIAARLLLALLLACALVWGAIYALGHRMVYAQESGSFDREMQALALAIARVADQAGDDPARLAAALEGLAAKLATDTELLNYPEGFLAFSVWDQQGQLLRHAGLGPVLAAQGPGGYSNTADTHRVYRRDAAQGRYQLAVTQSMRSRHLNFDSVMISREGLLQPLLVAFPLVLLPVWLSVHTGLRPLRQLSRELSQRRPGDLAPLRVAARYAELEPVVRELNTTLDRLRGLLQRERSFLADAAHELRTPLAVISAQRDRLLRSASAEDRQQATERLGLGIARAGRLVGQLLALARMDAEADAEAGRDDPAHLAAGCDAHSDAQPSAIDLADLARDSLATQAAEAQARGIELSYLGPDHAPVHGPLQVFESIIDNLVSNAVRYGRVGGRVELRLEHAGGRMLLEVRDDGPGIPPERREAMFERFVRGEQHGMNGTNGSGLGLAIVRAAARRLGAAIETGPGLGGQGISFRLAWAAVYTEARPTAESRL